jgi:transcriptional regulator with XRE-family HTH domain
MRTIQRFNTFAWIRLRRLLWRHRKELIELVMFIIKLLAKNHDEQPFAKSFSIGKIMLNEALRLLRVYHDLKAIELAEKLAISASYLSEIESGKKEPTLELIRTYAEVFNTSPSAILFFSEDIAKVGRKRNFRHLVRKKTIQFLQAIENGQTTAISAQ